MQYLYRNFYRNFFSIPYSLSLYGLKYSAKLFFSADLWPRHSYLDHTFIPFKSDLDISVYIESIEQRTRFAAFYKSLKKIFPFLGEVNYYYPASINFLNKYGLNSFELKRDPQLLAQYLPDTQLMFSLKDALVYLHRTFMSDYETIRIGKKINLLKWQKHFNFLNKKLKETDPNLPFLSFKNDNLISSIATSVINLSGFNNKEKAETERIKFQLMAELINSRKNYFWTPQLVHEFKTLLYYCPEYVCYYDFNLPEINPKLFFILLAEIEWFTLVNLRKACNPEFVQHGLSETELFINLLNKITNNYKNAEAGKTLLILNEAKAIFLQMSQR